MSFDLKYSVKLSSSSSAVYDRIIQEFNEKKNVDYPDVVELISRAAGAFKNLTLESGKILDDDEQRQLLRILFETLAKNDTNDFIQDDKIDAVIDSILRLRNGEFEVDLGSNGIGCFKCCSTFKISAKR